MIQEDDDYRDVHKIIMVGDAGAGKSNLVHCFVKEKAPVNVMPTVAVEFAPKLVQLDGERKVKAQVWDTAGQEAYRSMTLNYYRNMEGAVIVFDVCKRSSYDHIGYWLQNLRQRAENVVVLLVGHKIDHARREVSKEEAESWAKKERVMYAETTIRDVPGIQDAFRKLLNGVIGGKARESGGGFRLNEREEEESGGCAC